MDESMPSPGEIRSEKTIVLPEIVSMPECIRRHCAEEIIPIYNVEAQAWYTTGAWGGS